MTVQFANKLSDYAIDGAIGYGVGVLVGVVINSPANAFGLVISAQVIAKKAMNELIDAIKEPCEFDNKTIKYLKITSNFLIESTTVVALVALGLIGEVGICVLGFRVLASVVEEACKKAKEFNPPRLLES